MTEEELQVEKLQWQIDYFIEQMDKYIDYEEGSDD